ncbi:MAG TPA: SIR2 family protein [Verrucomicrobiae bacterium]
MTTTPLTDFTKRLEAKVSEQLAAQRLGYLLGAGSSYLGGSGYPLAFELWDQIKDLIPDIAKRAEIQAKLDSGAQGIERALDLLDTGLPTEGPHRHLVTEAIAKLFGRPAPALDAHIALLSRLANKGAPCINVFSLNYDPLLERAAEEAKIRVCDGFLGHEHAYFDPSTFEERIGRIRGTHKGRQFDETTRPIRLFKLHGSLGWYEASPGDARRCAFSSPIPPSTRRLMIPPQHRKANDTMMPPYSALWSAFRGCLGQNAVPINRLACLGYGFLDEHVNAVIEPALARSDFSLLVFTRSLTDTAWARWSPKPNTIIVTETRSTLRGEQGPGHPDLWKFERLAKTA